ncbi:MAG TPA: PhzF family phenazine biosynthesis protein [Terriglobales bacterium]
MRTPIYQIDAFTSRVFGGNPAAVLPMEHFPSDATMLAIAAENNLSETAFLVAEDGDYRLRWFTPLVEVPLCGHATLASAAVVMERLETGRNRVVFHSASGPLTVTRSGAGYVMDFPARPSQEVATPAGLAEALGAVPIEVRVNAFNYMAVLENAELVRRLAPEMAAVARMDRPGVIVTARGDGIYDFISRYFAPAKGIPEDPVTGAAHCMLAPYWAQRLGKAEFRACQASRRGGEIVCRVINHRTELEGSCVFYLEGEVEI